MNAPHEHRSHAPGIRWLRAARVDVVAFAAIAVGVVLSHFHLVRHGMPFGDPSACFHFGRKLLDGAVPYRDYVYQAGPLPIYIDGAFQAFLRTALLNRIRDEIRRAHRRPTDVLASDRPADGPSPIEEAIGSEALARYEAALQRLKPNDREAIIARIELGLPYTEVAQALGKPSVAAAHVAVSRALLKLAREMSIPREES